MNAPARSAPAARRKVRSVSDLRVESCPRHIQHVAASPVIRTVAISNIHQRRSPERPKNKPHDRTGATTGVSFVKRRLAGDTVVHMHPDRRWAVDVTALQSAAKSRAFFFGFCRHTSISNFISFFCFFVCWNKPQKTTLRLLCW